MFGSAVGVEGGTAGGEDHHFVGATGDAVHAQVAVEALDAVVAGDAHASQDLQGAVHDPERGLGAVVLRHRAVAAGQQAVVVLPGDLVEHVAHVGQAHLHLGELQLGELVPGDGLAALDALVGVLGGVLEGAVGGAVVGQGDQEALEVEVGDAAAEAVALLMPGRPMSTNHSV